MTQAFAIDEPPIVANEFYWGNAPSASYDLRTKGLGTADPQMSMDNDYAFSCIFMRLQQCKVYGHH
jgi:hypothetical protein